MQDKLKKLKPESAKYAKNEAGMAQLFADCKNSTILFCPEKKLWYTYHNGTWKADTGNINIANEICKFCNEELMLYAIGITDEDKRRKFIDFINNKLGNRKFRDSMQKDVADKLAIRAERFDNDPYLLNVKNGTINLRTMEFKQHDPKDYLTMQTRAEFSDEAEDSKWNEFIKAITEQNEQKADYLQRALGYSISGENTQDCMFILYGKSTRNGKSTLLNAIQYLLGDYSTVTKTELITRTGRTTADAPQSQLASLKGKRFVTMSETQDTNKLNEAAIKQYTGGEEITARELYERRIVFQPQFTLWLSCNILPEVRDRSIFASDRVRVIELNRHFSEAEQDRTLKQYFRSQKAMKAILTWLLQGYNSYKIKQLKISEELKQATRKYERDNDLVRQFLEDRTVPVDEGYVKAKSLYEAFKKWGEEYDCIKISAKKFYAELSQHPELIGKRVTLKGYPHYSKIALKPP